MKHITDQWSAYYAITSHPVYKYKSIWSSQLYKLFIQPLDITPKDCWNDAINILWISHMERLKTKPNCGPNVLQYDKDARSCPHSEDW